MSTHAGRLGRAAVAIALVAAALPAGAGAAAKPNVVLLMTDDQTVENMRVMPRTRHLLGGSGTTFANSFSSYPLCCPARATTLTGQYAHNHGVFGNLPPTGGYGALTRKDNTLPVWLREAGYYTTHIGKYLNGYGRDAAPDVPPGWDEWYGSVDPLTYFMWGYTLYENGTPRTYGQRDVEDPSLYQTDVYRDKAVELIRRRAPSPRPFYLSVGFLAPHSEGGREFGTEGATVRSAPRHRGRFTDMPIPRLPGFNEADVSDKPPFFGEAFPLLDSSGIDLAHNYYRSRAESLLAVDEAIEAIVRALKRSGELNKTLIVFASDNGFLTGEHRVPFGKYLVYEPSIRVPTILRGPGVKRGATARELVVNPDLTATIVDAAGAKAGRRMDGRSMLPFARKPSRRTKRPILLETGSPARGDLDQDGAPPPFLAAPPIPRYQAIRTERFIYVEYSGGQRELYDLARDPAQLRSRDADPAYRRTRRALARRLDALHDCKGRACRAEINPVPGPSR
jgi:arylsulfatase A-like enzyme